MTPGGGGQDDREAFERAMAGVKRLAPGKEKARAPKPRATLRRADDEPPAGAALLRDGEGDDAGFRARDIGRDVLRRLRRGELEMESSIDLHGLAAADARRELSRALRLAAESGDRGLRIIHGRGLHSSGRAVLRDLVRDCLQQPPLLRYVSAFAPAPPRAGGAGVTQVLLRAHGAGVRS